MKTLSKSLGIDMAGLAQLIKSKGRGRDTVLAHITPKEAALLKSRGGRGSINPNTGLPEYENEYDSGGFDTTGYTDSGNVQTAQQAFGGQDYNSFFDTGASSTTSAGDNSGAAVDTPSSLALDRSAQIADESGTGGFDVTGYTPSGAAQTPAEAAPGYDYQAQGVSPQTGAAIATPDTSDKSNWFSTLMKDLGSAAGGAAGLLKLAGTAGVGAIGANYAQQAAQQGQAAANQIGAMAQPVQQRAAAAQTALAGPQPTSIASQAQNYGQQAVNAIGQVIPQFQQIGQNITALGKPLTDQGLQQMQQATSGALTPANQAALDALRAQAQQNISARGGVGAMQAGVAEQNARAQLAQQQMTQGQGLYQAGAQYALQGQSMEAQAAQLGLNQAQVQLAQNNLANQIQSSAITLGLQQAGIADQYTQQAIMVGLQSDQQLATNMQNFYKSLAQVAFGTPMAQSGQTATRATG